MIIKTTRLIPIILFIVIWGGCKKERNIHSPGDLIPKTVIEDPSLPSIIVNGVKLHSEAFGHPDSSLLFVLHGGPGADYKYLLNCKEFANKGYRVVFYDQRGAGLSQRLPYSTYASIETMYEELMGVIAHYKTSPKQKVFILGHSWGAMLACAFVNAHPNSVNGLILGEPGGLIWEDISGYIQRSQTLKAFSEDFNNAFYPDQLITGKKDEHEVLDYKLELMSASGDSKTSPTGNEALPPFWRFGAVSNKALINTGIKTKPNWTTNLHLFTTKVLFIYSENNKAYGFAHAQKVSGALPNVQLFMTKGAGHDMLTFSTGWSNTYPIMLNYLNSLK